MNVIIKQLSPITINRIAAGEVIERPASVVKELVENSIDSGANQIEINIANGGRNLVSVTDNGCGMNKEELILAIQKHTTSKLNEDDISNIQHLGFRGEAIPSIASISKMSIISKHHLETEHAWSLSVSGGETIDLSPASLLQGTKIIVRDLFFSTPVRLKFLKSEKAEAHYITDIVKKLALSHPNVNFLYKSDKKIIINTNDYDKNSSVKSRIANLLGDDFINNSIEIDAKLDDRISLSGFVSYPTLNKGLSNEQYIFINKRPVVDKLILTAIKIAYQDFLASGRYPIVVLFLDIDNSEVDVNVHPTKAEVRFRDPSEIRNFIIGSIKSAIRDIGHKNSSTNSEIALQRFISEKVEQSNTANSDFSRFAYKQAYMSANQPKLSENNIDSTGFASKNNFASKNYKQDISLFDSSISQDTKHYTREYSLNPKFTNQTNDASVDSLTTEYSAPILEDALKYPLGIARAQLHDTYIVAQSNDGIIFVDQHAAHERIVYEELKNSYHNNSAITQRLLIPSILEFDDLKLEKLLDNKEEFRKMGLFFETFGLNSIKVTEIPTLLGECNIDQLISDLADNLVEYDENVLFIDMLNQILSTFACHHSIRKGRKLTFDEMNALLRRIENTIHSGQCNHGRPTYIEMKLKSIENLFGRT